MAGGGSDLAYLQREQDIYRMKYGWQSYSEPTKSEYLAVPRATSRPRTTARRSPPGAVFHVIMTLLLVAFVVTLVTGVGFAFVFVASVISAG